MTRGRSDAGTRGYDDTGEKRREDAQTSLSESARPRVFASARLVVVLAITLVALLLRLRAVFLLPVDADEPIYLAVAAQYAADLQAGNLWGVIALDRTLEHPALAKLLYAQLLAITRPSSYDVALHLLRGLSAVLGAAQVFLLALLSPLAGFALAIHTMTIKYTSQVYLEAVPGFFAIAAMLAFERWRRPPAPNTGGARPLTPYLGGARPPAPNTGGARPLAPNFGGTDADSPQGRGAGGAWLLLSAVCLGATAAGKYPYLAVGLAILPFLPWRQRNWRAIGLLAVVSVATFFVLNVSLWADPLARLARSLSFHPAFSQSAQVTRYAYPWWKPLDYLLHPVPWHPGVFYLGWDTWIVVLGLLGLPLLWRRSRPLVLWAVIGLAVLLLWPTKWPQYTLIVIPPLCLSLGYGIADALHWANQRFQLSFYLAPFAVPRLTLVLAAVAGLAVALVLFAEGLFYWQGRLGWELVTTHNSGLVSDDVQALAHDGAGRIWVGTRAGLSLHDGDAWTTYTAQQGALMGDRVQALAVDAQGVVWAGTAHGLSAFDGTQWRSFSAAGAGGGPSGDDVRDLAIDAGGRLWVATTSGLSMYDGRAWTPYRAGATGLPSDLVFAVAIGGDGRIWAGTNRGAGVLDPRTQTWQRYDQTNSGLEADAVSAIALSADGRVWLGTLGAGITIYDGTTWVTQTTSNSGLPWNTVMALAAGPQGDVWVAADLPTEAGGNVARWDGQTWKTFTPQHSGIAGGAASCFAFDNAGRVYIGMRHSGISIYTARANR